MEIIAGPIIGDWTYDNAAANADIEGLDIEYSIDDPFYTFNPDGMGMQGVTITIAGNDPEKFEQKFYWENGNATADFNSVELIFSDSKDSLILTRKK